MTNQDYLALALVGGLILFASFLGHVLYLISTAFH